ncbi:hypothetical protein BDM02DRAFT_3118752, partial [Thelephora ganbajun]
PLNGWLFKARNQFRVSSAGKYPLASSVSVFDSRFKLPTVKANSEVSPRSAWPDRYTEAWFRKLAHVELEAELRACGIGCGS